jgi:hypothetical protein
MKDSIQFETITEANNWSERYDDAFDSNGAHCPIVDRECVGIRCASAVESEVGPGFFGNFVVIPAHCRNPMVTGIFIAKREE